ncbi:MAG: response regulator [Planctomycetota bacterium]
MSQKTTILIVDDSESARERVVEVLTTTTIEVIEAMDGLEGLQATRAGGIDCVITDVNMPRMTGIEMIAEIRKEPRFNDLPILVLSIDGAIHQIAEAKRVGASGWIIKPFKTEILRKAVAALVDGDVAEQGAKLGERR